MAYQATFGSSWQREELLDALRAADVVCAPVNSLVEVTEEPHNWENGYLVEVEHPEGGRWAGRRVRVQGKPIAFRGTPAEPVPGVLGHFVTATPGLECMMPVDARSFDICQKKSRPELRKSGPWGSAITNMP